MTGENADELASKRESAKKKKKKENDKNKDDTPKPPESEFSTLSDATKTESEGEPKLEVEGELKEKENVEEDEVPERKKPAKLVPVDRSKFGKFIVTYGELKLKFRHYQTSHHENKCV